MILPDPDVARIFNIVMTVAVALIGGGVILAQRGTASSYARADRFSIRVRLPYGTTETRDAVMRVLRKRALSVGIAAVAAAGVSALFLPTPFGTDPLFVLYALFLGLAVGGVVANVIVSVREQLFHPAVDAPRVARVRTMHLSDYFGPVHRLLPWMLAAVAVLALTTMTATSLWWPQRVDPVAATAAAVFAIVAVLVFAALPALQRLVLARPQPATQSLELAWDDALRAAGLRAMLLSAGIGAWLVIALAVAAMWIGVGGQLVYLAYQMPVWGVLALQFIYPASGRRMPGPLYPDWLRPAVMGGST